MRVRAKHSIRQATGLRTKHGAVRAWRGLRGVFSHGPKHAVAWQRRIRRDRLS